MKGRVKRIPRVIPINFAVGADLSDFTRAVRTSAVQRGLVVNVDENDTPYTHPLIHVKFGTIPYDFIRIATFGWEHSLSAAFFRTYNNYPFPKALEFIHSAGKIYSEVREKKS